MTHSARGHDNCKIRVEGVGFVVYIKLILGLPLHYNMSSVENPQWQSPHSLNLDIIEFGDCQ
jgi:hypothetical protein